MKTAISLPDSLFAAAQRLAGQLGISRSELFRIALSSFLKRHGQDGVTKSLNQLYGPGEETAHLDPLLEGLQGASLVKEDW